MYCPDCKSEYRDGFTWCKDCDVALVAELPPEKEPEFVDLVEVLSIADPGQVALVKSILDADGIPYLAQGEHFGSLHATIPIRFLVPRDYLSKAKEILADFL